MWNFLIVKIRGFIIVNSVEFRWSNIVSSNVTLYEGGTLLLSRQNLTLQPWGRYIGNKIFFKSNKT